MSQDGSAITTDDLGVSGALCVLLKVCCKDDKLCVNPPFPPPPNNNNKIPAFLGDA